jgi:hypothetical protein
MILDAQGRPVQVSGIREQPPKPRMHTCLWCHRRSRLGTHCCNARYREDSKFNARESHHGRLNPHMKRGKLTKHGLPMVPVTTWKERAERAKAT